MASFSEKSGVDAGLGFRTDDCCNNPSAHVAQSVEHFLGKEEVTGSIPVVSTTRGSPLSDNAQFRSRIFNHVQREV